MMEVREEPGVPVKEETRGREQGTEQVIKKGGPVGSISFVLVASLN